MQPRTLPRPSKLYDFRGKSGVDKLYAIVRAAQEETIRDYVECSENLIKDDIDAAWKVLVPSGETSISRADLMERLSYYVPHNDISNTTNLIGGGGNLTYDKLMRLLWNEANSEPALQSCNMGKESWSLLDPHGRGSVALDSLLRMISTLPGCDKLDSDDVAVVRTLLEMTPEGSVVREENWQQLGSWAPKLEELTPAQRKLLAASRGGISLALRGPARLSASRGGRS